MASYVYISMYTGGKRWQYVYDVSMYAYIQAGKRGDTYMYPVTCTGGKRCDGTCFICNVRRPVRCSAPARYDT